MLKALAGVQRSSFHAYSHSLIYLLHTDSKRCQVEEAEAVIMAAVAAAIVVVLTAEETRQPAITAR